MSPEQQQLEAGIAALEAQRALLGDAVVDASIAGLRAKIAALASAAPAAEPTQTLKQVSILFLDVVGSTRLSEHLDPEAISAVMDDALARGTAIVEAQRGKVLQYAGDNLLAAFGAEASAEDDAERAVHCGLALQALGRALGAEVEQRHGHAGFGVRVGIHTGGVLLGGGVDAERTIRGIAVNIAARLEQTAAPGTVRISIDTYRQVQDVFDVLEQPPMPVKGLQEPLRSFVVTGARERRLRALRRGAEGPGSPMVGRSDELGRLLERVAAACAPGGGVHAATVIGEAGLGKSRLLSEFQAALPGTGLSCTAWRVASHPQGQGQPYGLLRDLLFWRLGVRDSDTQAQAQASFVAGLAAVYGEAADEQTALLGQLVGLDFSASPHIAGILRDVRQLRARGLNAWMRLLRHQAAAQPTVLVMDDLQWADDESLAALDHVVATAPELPVMLLCAARPELLQRRPQWGAAWPRHERLDLSPLDAGGSDALAAALLVRLAEPSPSLVALLREQAAGNPFYMEALLQMLVDTEVIQTDGGRWRVRDEGLADLKVPPTLVGVLQATLDALEAGQRRSLQQASVVGAQFWDEALAAIDARAPGELPALHARGLALPQAESSFDGTREYGFRHHLLHQVTYGTVLKADKRAAHAQVAQWLQARGLGRENELASQIAEHHERGGDTQQALLYWTRAAEDAGRRQADSLALAHAGRALALDDGRDLRRLVTLHQVRAAVLLRAAKSVEHGQAVSTLESLAEQLDDDVLRLAVAYGRAWLLIREARYEDAIALGEGLLARAGARAPAEAARLHDALSICLTRLGRREQAQAHVEQGLARARSVGDWMTEANILNNTGVHHMEADRLGQALTCFGQAIDLYRGHGNRHGVMNVLLNLAVIEETVGRFDPARDLYRQVIRECDEVGAFGLKAMACANLAGVLAEVGDGPGALETATAALRLAQLSADRRSEAFARRGARLALGALGRWRDALDQGREAARAFTECGYPAMAWAESGRVARTLSELGEPVAALEAAEALLAEVAAGGGWSDSGDAQFHLYRVLAPLGDPRAAGLLESAHRGVNALADLYADVVPRATYLAANGTVREICAAWAAGRGEVAGAAPG
ncbi:MAG: AAA family ATPase [Rubrivivax sp.]|nr:AAA family ATPase [Rubrivivax sp.]